jgi:DUF1680 family protein
MKHQVIIHSGFWLKRCEINARQAIFHQWEQLEASGCIENFRIAAGEVEGLREGWFFADSDAYKWLDAAARISAERPDERLTALMDALIALIGRAQTPDGYIFTYNQIHFPGVRWHNLQIEHELYCHGHLIEAGVAHFETTGRTDLLTIARHAADRIVTDFKGKGPAYTPGHQEIEIALLKLHQVVDGDTAYFDMARQFIEQRGRDPLFAFSILRQNSSANRRTAFVRQQRKKYLAAHPDFKPYQLPPENPAKEPANIQLRWNLNALSGKYFQQHAPVRRQTVPVGHSVRFAYLETAIAMLAQQSNDKTFIPALECAWERMVARRMYVTGGIGSLPGLEGFGNDYELNPEYAYAETCAALGSMLWNWEMVQLTGKARYSDLFEWQLYNAAAVGMGLEGTTYLYNNPLACDGNVIRLPWYAVPCCPSNLSRIWADLGKYIYSTEPAALRIHQYISSKTKGLTIPLDHGQSVNMSLEMVSGLPWESKVRLKITASALDKPRPFELQFRQPSWADKVKVVLNGNPAETIVSTRYCASETPASGYDPHRAVFHSIHRPWVKGDVLEIDFDQPIRLRRAHPKVKGHRGKVAVTRGALVYCLESTDNPDIDIFTARLDADSLSPVFDQDTLGGIVKLIGKTTTGKPLIFIPYFLWGNRGPSQMIVWVNDSSAL